MQFWAVSMLAKERKIAGLPFSKTAGGREIGVRSSWVEGQKLAPGTYKQRLKNYRRRPIMQSDNDRVRLFSHRVSLLARPRLRPARFRGLQGRVRAASLG
jgi:hypothetical protein